MGAYLIDHPPVRDQFYKTRNRPLTGCTVLHTAESVMDTVGPDTGAEAVAEFIRTRTTPGSYHDIADSDSYINLVPYESGAYHDGTGSNNWALSISFACGTHHWRQMSPERRAGFLRQGARAFAAQQAWRKAHGYPLTELRRITKAQSDAGVSGFIYHGDRDPGRRTDPGKNPPDLFPFDEWIAACRAELAGTPAPAASEEDDTVKYLAYRSDPETTDDRGRKGTGAVALAAPGQWYEVPNPGYFALLKARGVCGDWVDVPHNEFEYLRAVHLAPEGNDEAMVAALAKLSAEEATRAAQVTGVDMDEQAFAAALAPLLPSHVGALSDEDIERIKVAVADEQARRQAA